MVDRYDVDSRDLLGKVVWSSLILGKIVRLVSNPLIFVPIILVPLAIILIANLVKTVSYARKIAKDEEEAAVKEAIQYIREKNLRETGDTTESNENSERKSENSGPIEKSTQDFEILCAFLIFAKKSENVPFFASKSC